MEGWEGRVWVGGEGRVYGRVGGEGCVEGWKWEGV